MHLRRHVFTLLALTALLASVVPAPAALRTVLDEGFTQWNCPPCASWNPIERGVLESMTRDTVIGIKYHAWWPGANNDAFHLWNVSEATARINYYGVTGIPDGYIDGVLNLSRSASGLRGQIRTRRNIAAPCTIDISANLGTPTTVAFSGTINCTDSALTAPNTKLFVALLTDIVHYASPPGANGETVFDDIFRDMYPNTSGELITINQGGTYEFSGTLNKDAAWSPDSLAVVVFIQNSSTRWVHQAAWAPVLNFWNVQTTTTDARQMLVDPNSGEQVYSIQVRNAGANDDAYAISLAGQAPTGWTRSIDATGIPGDPNSITVPLTSGQETWVSIHMNPNGYPGNAVITMTVQSQNNAQTTATETFRLMAGPEILVVDDDQSGAMGDFEQYYLDALAATQGNRVVGWWDLHDGTLDQDALNGVPCAVWLTGSSPNLQSLTPAEQSMLELYLQAGGKLFLSGQGIAFDLRTSGFLHDMLHAGHVRPVPTETTMNGDPNDPVGNGLSLTLTGGDGANNQVRQNAIRPWDASASIMFRWAGIGGDTCSAIKAVGDVYRVVFFAFGFEAINSTAMRDTVMARTMNWLFSTEAVDPASDLTPAEFALGQNYPNPFNPETTIPYVLPERANVSLRVFDLLGREVAVLETGMQNPGSHAVTWNASHLSSGLYFYRLDATGSASFTATRKLMLLK